MGLITVIRGLGRHHDRESCEGVRCRNGCGKHSCRCIADAKDDDVDQIAAVEKVLIPLPYVRMHSLSLVLLSRSYHPPL